MMVIDDAIEYDLMISEERIQERVAEYAKQLDKDYAGKDLVIVMIMKGALCFVADLIRQMDTNAALDFLYCSSYRGSERGELTIHGLDNLDLVGRDVLLLDDIYDSGTTMSTVAERLREKGPASLKTIVLLRRDMPNIPARPDPDYVLFDIANNAFVIGYGLDYNERYRGLADICAVRQ